MQSRNEKTTPVPKRIRLLDVVLETARGEAGERTLKALLVLEERPNSRDIAVAWAKFGKSSVKLHSHMFKGLMLCFEIRTEFAGQRAEDSYPMLWLHEKAEDALGRFNASRSSYKLNEGVLSAASGWLLKREEEEKEALRSRTPEVLGFYLID